jgi:hypothetical protein
MVTNGLLSEVLGESNGLIVWGLFGVNWEFIEGGDKVVLSTDL